MSWNFSICGIFLLYCDWDFEKIKKTGDSKGNYESNYM